jgi:hypothetical protein
MYKLTSFLRAIREVIVLTCVLVYAQSRWLLWERWKKDAPKQGPLDSDVA